VIGRVIKDFKSHFPFLKSVSFIQFWPSLIDTTRDLLPIIVKPPTQPHLQFILGWWTPWAAFAGSFAARNILGTGDEDYKYFRTFRIAGILRCRPDWRSDREARALLALERLGQVLSGGYASKAGSRPG
jgi:glycine/D-amino acid oxidase-like deaminating enzyme